MRAFVLYAPGFKRQPGPDLRVRLVRSQFVDRRSHRSLVVVLVECALVLADDGGDLRLVTCDQLLRLFLGRRHFGLELQRLEFRLRRLHSGAGQSGQVPGELGVDRSDGLAGLDGRLPTLSEPRPADGPGLGERPGQRPGRLSSDTLSGFGRSRLEQAPLCRSLLGNQARHSLRQFEGRHLAGLFGPVAFFEPRQVLFRDVRCERLWCSDRHYKTPPLPGWDRFFSQIRYTQNPP